MGVTTAILEDAICDIVNDNMQQATTQSIDDNDNTRYGPVVGGRRGEWANNSVPIDDV